MRIFSKLTFCFCHIIIKNRCLIYLIFFLFIIITIFKYSINISISGNLIKGINSSR